MRSRPAGRSSIAGRLLLLAAAVSVFLFGASPAATQEISAAEAGPRTSTSRAVFEPDPAGGEPDDDSTPTARLVAAGALGAGAGLLAGGLAGGLIGGSRCGDPGNPDSCYGLEGVFIGANVVQALTIPLGVHLMNGRRGSYGTAVLITTAIAGGGLLTAYVIDHHPPDVRSTLTLSLAQVIASVIAERSTGAGTR